MTGILLFALVWVNGADIPLEGAPFGAFARLPADVRDRTNPEIRSMSGQTSGMKFRFRTDSRTMAVRWSLTDPQLHGWNMSPPGKSGIDIYEEEGCRYVATGISESRTNNTGRKRVRNQ